MADIIPIRPHAPIAPAGQAAEAPSPNPWAVVGVVVGGIVAWEAAKYFLFAQRRGRHAR